MINRFRKYLLLLWLIVPSVGVQLFANTLRTSTDSSAPATDNNPGHFVTTQKEYPLSISESAADKKGVLFFDIEKKVEEDNTNTHQKYPQETDDICSLLSLWRLQHIQHYSAIYTQQASYLFQKLFIVFCVYII